jgi:hypothetical protein
MPGEDKIQWLYYLEGPNSTIEVYDTKLYSWVLIVEPNSVDELESKRMASHDKSLFLKWLQKECQKTRVSKVDYNHIRIENGYQELYSDANYFVKYHQQVSKRVDAYERLLFDKFMKEGKTQRGWTRRIDGLVRSRFGFDSSAILWSAIVSYVLSAEAFLNLIYELYMKKEVTSDMDLVERIGSYSLREKWAMAFLTCDCFAKPLGKSSKGYNALSRLNTVRNNLAHANISRELKTYVFEEDGIEFVIQPADELYDKVPTPSLAKMENVERIRQDVDEVVQEVLHSMKPSIQEEFAQIVKWSGVLISPHGGRVRSRWF